MAEHRNIRVGCTVYQAEHIAYPREIVIHAHRSAHEDEPGKLARFLGDRFSGVHLEHAPGNAVRIQECGKITRPLGGRVAENGDGFHVRDKAFIAGLRIVAGLIFLLPAAGWAADVKVIGLFPGKAVVVIDGGAPRVLKAGQPPVDGVTLVSTDRETATFLVDGQKKTFKIGQHIAGPASGPGAQSATLTADVQGHFLVDGQINGGTVRFLVDTGATTIALSSADANRLGIDYRKGEQGLMGTANGTTVAYKIKLDSVRVGDIVVSNVDAAVLESNQIRFALLGMSFLNRMEMKRVGDTMVLIKRF